MSNILIWGITEYLYEHKDQIDWSHIVGIVKTKDSKDERIHSYEPIPVELIKTIDVDYMIIMDEDDERFLDYIGEDYCISKEYCSKLPMVLSDSVCNPIYDFVTSNIYAMGIRSVLDVNNVTIRYGNKTPGVNWPKIKLLANESKLEFPFYKHNLFDNIDEAECALFLDPYNYYDIPTFIEKLKEDYAEYNYIAFNLPLAVKYPKYINEWNHFPLEELGHVYVVKNDMCGTFCLLEPQKKTVKQVHMHVISHKEFDIKSTDRCYSKLYVGNICRDKPQDGNLESDGENISFLNPYINENTGIYWAWKNDLTCDYIGFCHYRRYFTSDDITMVERHILKQSEIERYLKSYDLIVSGVHIDYGKTIEGRFADTIDSGAFKEGMEIVRKIISEVQSEYSSAFEHVFSGHSFFPCNMFIMPRKIFEKYCQWLFSILPKACELFSIEKYDNYSSRAIGFIAERMLTVWLMKQDYRVKELPIQQVEG